MKEKKSASIILSLILSMLLVSISGGQGYTNSIKQDDALNWEGWYGSINDYIATMSEIINRGKQVATEADKRLSEAMQKDKRSVGKKIIAEIEKNLSTIVQELSRVNPPGELMTYHEKAIETYKYRAMGVDAILENNLDDYFMYTNTAISSEIESIEELIQVYKKHGASDEVIDALHVIIQALKEQFR